MTKKYQKENSKKPLPKAKKSEPNTDIDKLISKLQVQGLFTYNTEKDYSEYHPCRHGAKCCDDDYCRCVEITNAHVTSINTAEIFHEITNRCENKILCYCLDRILHLNQFYNPHHYTVAVDRGYYGEELGEVTFHNLDAVTEQLRSLADLSEVEQIKEVLKLEYGFVLPKLMPCTQVKIQVVDSVLVHLPNDTYTRKIGAKEVAYYSEYSLPRTVTLQTGDAFVVIDGYHRVTAALQNKKPLMEILVLS